METSTEDMLTMWNSTDTLSTASLVSSDTTSLGLVGAQRDSLYIVIPVTIIYISIFLTGTIGNISTCIVIARNKSMHTATNYYLFSLAVSDLLLLVSGLPAEVYLVWSKYPYIFGEEFCITRGLAAEFSTNATVLTITAFTVERYVAICHPFLSHTMSKLNRAIKIILVIWLVALCFAIPQALQFGIVRHPHISSDMVVCTLKTIVFEHSFELSTLLFFFVPMTLITVLYIMIGVKLKKSHMMKKRNIRNQGTRGSNETRRKKYVCSQQTGKSSRRVLKMLVAVVVAFFICWAPFHVQRLIAIYGTNKDHVSSKSPWMEFLYILFTYISGVLYYFSTTINPILYNIMSNKFREAFRETLARSCGGGQSYTGGQLEQRSYSSLSRSQPRTVGLFGSRTLGTRGSAVGQDSSEGSGNSVRDEKCRPSTSGQLDIMPCLNSDVQSSRNLGNIDLASCEATLTSCGNKRRLISANPTSDVVSNSQVTSLPPPKVNSSGWQCENNKVMTINGDAVNAGDKNLPSKYFAISSSRMGGEKKWWRVLKWLPGSRVFRLTKRSSNRADGMALDIESNREEYSMTACYVANSIEHRLV